MVSLARYSYVSYLCSCEMGSGIEIIQPTAKILDFLCPHLRYLG
jgi:hypothetical protein